MEEMQESGKRAAFLHHRGKVLAALSGGQKKETETVSF